jgi:hypothetical protein
MISRVTQGPGFRVQYFELKPGTGDTMNTYWMGIRSANKHGATGISNFENIWECEDGTNHNGTDATGDSSASNSAYVFNNGSVNWDDGDFHILMELLLSNVSANADDNLGKYLWLLRAKLSAGSTTWEVKLRFSYNNTGVEQTSGYVDKDPVEISTISWSFFEMGAMPIGMRDIHSILGGDFALSNEEDFRVDIYARRTSGTAALRCDCLCPIPVDEGFCKVDAPDAGSTDRTVFGFSPEGSGDLLVHTSTSTIVSSAGSIDPTNFVLPPGDGRIVIAYADDSETVIDNTIIINDGDVGRYFERWLSLRGSE